MGLMQQVYDTYCAMESQYAGIYGKAKEPLVPVSHQIVNAELELTLDADGHLLGKNGRHHLRAPPVRSDTISLCAVSRKIRKLPDTTAPLEGFPLWPPQALRHRPLCGEGDNR